MKNICILATGGTIDKEHDPISEALVFSEESHVPEMLKEFRVDADTIPHKILMLKDSLELTHEDRILIRDEIRAHDEEHIVITHGTSTMSVTAEFLQKEIKNKTMVLTGAMRPFSLMRSDAGFNLGSAIAAAQCLPYGAYITMNGQVFPAGTVRKNEKAGIFEAL